MHKAFSLVWDLVTPDGKIKDMTKTNDQCSALVHIENITEDFAGFYIDTKDIFFNIKSTLAQLGINAKTKGIFLSHSKLEAEVDIEFIALNELGSVVLKQMQIGSFVGKLFAADKKRSVRKPKYLTRMFGRSDRLGRPLLSFGSDPGEEHLHLETHNNKAIAYVPVLTGQVVYDEQIFHMIPSICKALVSHCLPLRNLLRLHQKWEAKTSIAKDSCFLLVKTAPLHVRTVFARVVDTLLPEGCKHTSACILQPDTLESGDIYELYGSNMEKVDRIPLEFYTLSPYQEHVFFSDRDQLQSSLDKPDILFKAFESAPMPKHHKSATFIVKGEQLLNLKPSDWISSPSHREEFPSDPLSKRMQTMVDRYIENQPSYLFLQGIEEGTISSEGILLTRYFPSPRMKRMFINRQVQKTLKAIYFLYPSRENGDFFSHEDRSFLIDLYKLSIPIYWVDQKSKLLLQYVLKPGKDVGMFVPLAYVKIFKNATMLGVYGSNLLEGNFLNELEILIRSMLEIKKDYQHPIFCESTELALVTGGGPGAMSVGNQVACKLGILSCANIVDFSSGGEGVINEQNQNPYIQAKMTYSLDRLVERQAEFDLDLPIFLMGGIGTDFEYALEEIRKKIGTTPAYPILLFGSKSYWEQKVSSRFECNLQSGTIKGSEWVSNCFFVVKNAQEALKVYKDFFSGKLLIGKDGPIYKQGFCLVNDKNI